MPVTSRRVSAFAGLLTVCLVASLLVVGPASAERRLHPWLEASDVLVGAVDANPQKIPVEFQERLDYELADGTMRVMVALSDRNAEIENFVGSNTTWVQWYGDAPRFLGRVTQTQMATLLEASFVTFVEPDYPITNFMSTSTLDVHARSLNNAGTGVWSYSPGPNGGSLVSDVPGLTADQATGKGVTVAITDSGIDRTHRDFGGWNCAAGPYQPCESRIRAAITIDHIVGAGVEPGPALPTTEAASGHGTHVAGTVAGNGYYTRFDPTPDTTRWGPDGHNFGIAPQASLISTKNGDSQSAGLSSFGLQWQLDNAEQLDIRVSSNSWGCLGGCSFNGNSATAQMFKDMYEAGIVVVFAAGNDGAGTAGLSNAQSPYVLGVANYDDGNHRLASSSSRGTDNTLPNASTWTPASEPANGEPRPDVAAPGTGIWSARTLTGGTSAGHGRVMTSDITGGSGSGLVEYVQMSGTSMATPHVSGAAALMFSACPTATPLDVMRAVMVGADPTEILKTAGTQTAQPSEVGYGSLEIRRSLDWLLTQPACGGTGGGTDPTPTPTTEPTSEPTPEPTSDPGTTTRYYFHSPSGFNNQDQLDDSATFDTVAPTFEEYSFAYDVPGAQNVTGGVEYVDPRWTGELAEPARSITVDFWGETIPDSAVASANYAVRVSSNGGDYVELAPVITRDDVEGGVVNIKHTFTEMLVGGAPVPLELPAGPLEFTIRGYYTVNDAVTEIRFDSKTYPSGFSANSSAGGGGTDPTPTPTATEEPPPPPSSGSRGTYPNPPNDPYYGTPGGPTDFTPQQWGMHKIKAAEAWQQDRATGYQIRVGVLDSGVDLQHEDLQCPGKLDVVAGSDTVGQDSDPDDENGHGTHVAGIIGACTNNNLGVVGVAPDATLVPIRVLNAAGDGNDAQLIAGLDKARQAGVHVVNMSLGYIPGKDIINNVAPIDAAIERAKADGIVLVAAAGNDSSPLCDYPALAEDIICVAASDPRDLKAAYSTFATKFDNEDGIGPGLVAPGGSGQPLFCDSYSENVLSTVPIETDDDGCTDVQGYQRNFGSSMASPHVAGVAALVYDRLGGVRSRENARTITEAIINNTDDLGTPGWDPVFGYGRLNALKAVTAVDAVVEQPAAATTLSFTDASATGVQHSDEALVQAVLTDATTGEPISGQEVAFEIAGSSGTRTWTFTTDADGVAGAPVLFTEAPGSYTVSARFGGSDDAYLASADVMSFVVDRDDSVTSLEVLGDRNNRQLRATVTDTDSGTGLAGVTVAFVGPEEGIELGTATTNQNGVAVIAVDKKYTKKETLYEATFGGSDGYAGSSDRQRM